MKKEGIINTALFLNILYYGVVFGLLLLEKLLHTTYSATKLIMTYGLLIAVSISYIAALVLYISSKERNVFQLIILTILLLVNGYFYFNYFLMSHIGWFQEIRSAALTA